MRVQYAPTTDNFPVLPKKNITNIQEMVGMFLYHAQEMNNTVNVTLNDSWIVQEKSTRIITYKRDMILDYMATNLDEKLRLFTGNIVLYIDSNAANLVVRGQRVVTQNNFI